jgi:hypothetical protein
MKAESTLFPPVPEYAKKIDATTAYWHRFTQDGVAVVKLMQKPVQKKSETGDILYEYDEIEIKIQDEDVGNIPKNFTEVWKKYSPKAVPVLNPVLKTADIRIDRAKTVSLKADLGVAFVPVAADEKPPIDEKPVEGTVIRK